METSCRFAFERRNRRGESSWRSGSSVEHRLRSWSEYVITRRRGGKLSLVSGDDKLFSHLLRQDLRRALWRRGFFTTGKDRHFREEFDGVPAAGIDYDMTVRLYRKPRRKVGGSKRGASSSRSLTDEPGRPNNLHPFVLNAAQRGACRLIWAGAIHTGERLHQQGMCSSSRCLFCCDGSETYEHVCWDCPAFAEQRKDLLAKYPRDKLDQLPAATRYCGLVVDETSRNDHFATLAVEVADMEAAQPMDQQPEEEMSVDSEGYAYIAGDGAAPDGQGGLRLWHAGCGLFYKEGHSRNTEWALEGCVQTAQRAEVRAALRWVLWALCKQVYIVDSDYVHKGLQSIIDGRPLKFRSHRDLWRRIEQTMSDKGLQNFRTKRLLATNPLRPSGERQQPRKG